MKVLVDNSVLHHAIEHRGERKSSGMVMWGGENGIPVNTGMLISMEKPIMIKETKGGPQGKYIASLALANASGEWEAHTSDALMFERFHQRSSKFMNGNMGGFSWFKEVKYELNDTLTDFELRLPEDCLMDKLRDFLDSSEDQDYKLIRDQLAKSGAQKSNQDAWHIHCVRLLGLDRFLTCDTRLIGQINNISNRKLKQKILGIVTLPSDLCSALDLDEAPENELNELREKFSFGN